MGACYFEKLGDHSTVLRVFNCSMQQHYFHDVQEQQSSRVKIILWPAPVKLSGQTYFFSDTNCFWQEKCLFGPISASLFLIFH